MDCLVSLEKGLEIIDKNINGLNYEIVDILESLNRISFEDIYSEINIPPFNKSAMDGYAIDTNDKSESLEVIHTVFAGDKSYEKLRFGKVIKIMTGAEIPIGANAVIKKEDVIVKDNLISFNKNIEIDKNICYLGEDILKGERIVNQNKKLDYADIGLLASCGIKRLKVYRSPKIALITTGDEVVDLNIKALDNGKIYNTNKYSILSRLKELGFKVDYINHLEDDSFNIRKIIEELSIDYDLIITTGGVSVGDKDLIIKSLNYNNENILFWKIDIKPGSSMAFSKINNSAIVSLSGNPTAALTTFELIVVPILNKFLGGKRVDIIKEKAILKDNILNKGGKIRFLRGKAYIENSVQYVELTQLKSGNGIISSNRNSNCLIFTKEKEKKHGDIIDIIKL